MNIISVRLAMVFAVVTAFLGIIEGNIFAALFGCLWAYSCHKQAKEMRSYDWDFQKGFYTIPSEKPSKSSQADFGSLGD